MIPENGLCRTACIDGQNGACNVSSILPEQKLHGGGDIRGFRKTPERASAEDLLPLLVSHCPRHVTINKSRRNGVDVYV